MRLIILALYLVVAVFPFATIGSTHWHIDKNGKVSGGLDAIKSLPSDANDYVRCNVLGKGDIIVCS